MILLLVSRTQNSSIYNNISDYPDYKQKKKITAKYPKPKTVTLTHSSHIIIFNVSQENSW